MKFYINWDVTPEIIEGWNTPNWYGLLFVTGLILGYFVVRKMFRTDNIDESYMDKLVVYMIVATIVGARLGHVFFYDWAHYKNNLGDILKVWEGGLASHGGAIAILIALYVFARWVIKMPYLWILDRIVVAIALTGCFIRLGNLVNSEIVGKLTDVPWAFTFPHYYNPELVNEVTGMKGAYDPRPRHAAQLYEAITYIISFVILYRLYWKKKLYRKPGVIFGAFLILIWGARFTIEFWKVGQADRDADLLLNTGQLLSIPFIILGVILIIIGMRKPDSEPDVSHLAEVEKK